MGLQRKVDQFACLPRQELVNDWFATTEPSAEFAFATDGEFGSWPPAKEATVHWDARPGQFLPEPWRYDLNGLWSPGDGTTTGNQLCPPNGAWWAGAPTRTKRASTSGTSSSVRKGCWVLQFPLAAVAVRPHLEANGHLPPPWK